MNTKSKMLASALIVGVLGGLVALGVSGAFSATTQNAGNEIQTGTVALSDNDGGQALFNVNNAQPGQDFVRCIKVSYSGSLPAQVRTYLQSTPGSLTNYLDFKVETGAQTSGTFPDCGDFTADAGEPLYTGPITSAVFGDYNSGLVSNPAGQSRWNQGDSVVYRITMKLSDAMPNSIQGATTGPVTVVWEARDA